MPPSRKVSSFVSTGPCEEEIATPEVVVSETLGIPLEESEESIVSADLPPVPEDSSSVSERAPALSEVLNKMQEAASRTVKAASSGSGKPSGKEEDSTVRVETKAA